MEKTYDMTWEKYFNMVHKVYEAPKFKAAVKSMSSFYPVTDSDSILAALLAEHTGLKVVDEPNDHTIVVSNVVDTGESILKYPKKPKVILISRKKIDSLNPYYDTELYIKFPWENVDKNLIDTIRYVISAVGGDTTRLDHLPPKIINIFDTLFDGYNSKLFMKRYVIKNKSAIITKHSFFSTDDESGLSFYGTVQIAYFPSKYALDNPGDIVDHFSHQITNTNLIADNICTAVQKKIKPKGIVIKVTAVNTYKKYLKEPGKVKAMATKGDTSLLWKVL